jgi:hypothetical protein
MRGGWCGGRGVPLVEAELAPPLCAQSREVLEHDSVWVGVDHSPLLGEPHSDVGGVVAAGHQHHCAVGCADHSRGLRGDFPPQLPLGMQLYCSYNPWPTQILRYFDVWELDAKQNSLHESSDVVARIVRSPRCPDQTAEELSSVDCLGHGSSPGWDWMVCTRRGSFICA